MFAARPEAVDIPLDRGHLPPAVLPDPAVGPPPAAPMVAAGFDGERCERCRRVAATVRLDQLTLAHLCDPCWFHTDPRATR